MSTNPKCRCQRVFSLRKLVDECCRPLAYRFAERAIRAAIDVPDDLMIVADRELLRRAVQNLVLGAVAAMPNGGALVVTSASGPEAVELEIADTGESLDDDQLRRAFDPSGDETRGTTGWSLAAVRKAVEAHWGSVSVANCPEGGVAFTLRIPRPPALEAAA
ncbi:MAG: HAMP domain-containing histidine kinase [Pirellulales bacterium]|nr:HAMP domain-containing histidine kinase [Pirellulales bacterium]